MTIDQALGYIVEGLLALVFLSALTGYVRRRDPVSRGVALTFSPFVAILLASVWRQLGGPPPAVISVASGVLLLLQPVFALHLVSLIRPVPRRVQVGAFALIAVTIAPAIVIRPIPAVLGAAPLLAFVGVEVLAAGHLLIESRRRTGPGARRLEIAAASTALFAAALLAAGAGAIGPVVADASRIATLVLALLAACGYLVAFMPPASIRRLWQAGATVRYQHDLLRRSADPVEAIWRGYADLAASVTGAATAVIVSASDGSGSVAATSGFGVPAEGDSVAGGDLAELVGAVALDVRKDRLPAASLRARLADSAGATLVSTVSLGRLGTTNPAALAVLSRHHSLFHASDLELLATLGAQTAVVAERRAVLAEQEVLAARLESTVEALRTASQAKSDFLASMSHELRTPLSAILGFSDLMRQEESDGDSVRVPLEWVEHIHRGGEHLLSLINDVLDLAKVEAGRLDLHTEPIDLAPAVTELLNGVAPLAERKRLRLVSVTPAISLVADRGRLRQVLYNLLSNAIKFTPPGGEIRVEAEEIAGEVRISVVDSGVGIAPDDQATVFDEFRQVGETAARVEGTGLGLALSRRLMEAHGGRIELESTIGRGSRFTIVFPTRSMPLTVSAPRTAISQASRQPEPGLRDVLVIEDDPSAVRLLREYLEPAGYRLRAASSGERGLAFARESRPAAIILDVLLPTIDGWEVLRRLKADPTLRDVPVIIVTVVDEREIGLALGAADYLVKPVPREALLSRLERLGIARATPGQALRVLAVDDEPAALALVGAALEGQGYDVVSVLSGREAVARVRDGGIDMIICDLVMPDLDGFGVIAMLKADPATAEIPILICTARDLSDDERTQLNEHVLGIVAKGSEARDGLRAWLAKAIPLSDQRAGDAVA
jgi:signal transduction histidine kinase/DNA-binding response OmpR family regulator